MGRDGARSRSLTDEDEQVNQASALWARPKSEITEEQYHEFYKHVAHDFEPPLAYTHAKVEGRQEYTQLLFIPQRAPFDLWDREHRHGIKLYVRRVFIMDDAEQLMPAVPALRARRRSTRTTCRSTSRARSCSSRATSRRSATASVKRVLGLLEDLADEPAGQVRDVLEGVRPRAQGRRRRGPGQPRAHRQAAALRVDARRQPTSRPSRSPTTSAG